MPRALITGVTGQDGRLLSAWLLDRGYEVVGITRGAARARRLRGMPSHASFSLVESSLAAYDDVAALLADQRPDEIYNLASQSSPVLSWQAPLETGDASGMSAHRLFDAARRVHPRARIYQASSSEMFGGCEQTPQNERTPLLPLSPYAAAKVYAHQTARIYRDTLGLFIACGILFNHESTLRPMHYLTQHIAYGAACARLGIADAVDADHDGAPIVADGKLLLGNLAAKRDWGAAQDYVRAMWLMLQQDVADDFVVGTGKLRSVAELCEIAYRSVDLDWRDHVRSDPRRLRPADSGARVADPRRAREQLGWSASHTIESVLREMIAFHIEALERRASGVAHISGEKPL
jgi:GDPmannose 4,6-dehydratase